ncbi:hypothetical protein RSOLAG22IIIB_04156 [Rhizoctonia solani]|uniref:Uncharacterized protein n=1 Tax=Rhizoctonia solani TaxID=456999 RepID=A0A0K6FVW1_9AGAM|nr:hypothetical protein RSOLAG22IIIB_04156 [Rhizoctonia solani]
MSSYETLTAEEIKQLLDAVVWSSPDDVILAASQAKWRAPVYGHYVPSVEGRHNEQKIWYKFTCKCDPQRHKALYRWRKDDSSGTKKFIDAANQCNRPVQSWRAESCELAESAERSKTGQFVSMI